MPTLTVVFAHELLHLERVLKVLLESLCYNMQYKLE